MSEAHELSSCARRADLPGLRNRPGLSEVAYRAGVQTEFLERMLDALSRDPDLRRLSTRALSDPAISLIDAWAVVLDILSFYNERIANEGWLRTATERRSIAELARQVGYQLNPGVSAHTWLAFTVEGTLDGSERFPMPQGLKVQSIPGPDETPQIFETETALEARTVFNTIRPLQAQRQVLGRRSTSVWLAGTDTGLERGDLILLVGADRLGDPGSERWDVRSVHELRPDPANARTEVVWLEDLGHSNPHVEPEADPEVYAFDVIANLFGHNAPDARTMPTDTPVAELITDGEWDNFAIASPAQRRVYLDAVYDNILPGSWVMLAHGGLRELYRVEQAAATSRADFTLAAKSTRLRFDTDERLSWFSLRSTRVFAASRRLARADAPVQTPICGDLIAIGNPQLPLVEGQRLLLSGRRLEAVAVAPRSHVYRTGATTAEGAAAALLFEPDDGAAAVPLADHAQLTLLGPPLADAAGSASWPVALADGRRGRVAALMGEDLLPLAPLPAEDAFAPRDESLYASELVTVRRIEQTDAALRLFLTTPLSGVYWRPSVELNGNVVAATHGETRYELTSALSGQRFTETLGSGDASRSMQRFRLSQKPLTYTQSDDPSGGTSSLTVRVDGVAWTEVETLYGQPPGARVYATEIAADGHLVVSFGDGRFGARLPGGQGNVTATYRVGIGLAGLLRARQISLAMDQPLGLKSVINPLPATGAQDPEQTEDARQNAPLTVLTLDRVVSIRDFEDFARAFAGIAKAQATAVWSGERQLVHITAVGVDGAVLAADDTTLINLRAAIDGARHSERPVIVSGHRERRFGLTLRVGVEDGREAASVLGAARSALLERYGLEARELAQGAVLSELIALVQDVTGVTAVILTAIDGAPVGTTTRLPARRARWNNALGAFEAAELLLIDDKALHIEELTP
ncbi:MAG: hypothetical protein V2I82_11490 [Halieaceae bacterium]|jgi:hypothetical protein|nr:hypothetical protein [Halieaceae bacterium]